VFALLTVVLLPIQIRA